MAKDTLFGMPRKAVEIIHSYYFATKAQQRLVLLTCLIVIASCRFGFVSPACSVSCGPSKRLTMINMSSVSPSNQDVSNAAFCCLLNHFSVSVSRHIILTDYECSTNQPGAGWAGMGECESNPNFMLINCARSCFAAQKAAEKSAAEVAAIDSFFDLKANDIDGNVFNFESLRGQVTVMTNVASYCGYTESHYKGLVELYSATADKPVTILAFPCNQFGKQEPGTSDEIKAFAAAKGVQFKMMEKIDVNGPDAHLVYKYLKHHTQTSAIGWNFA